ncbi:hypothetical protein AXF42_Ash010421 [Apostasia shenzhenica]|uniref:Endonuclease/exonuclease/phosphatase domain-containing protein n=1 Tax=Apostasia shenzhenica TaxID=1088818 RepID=A0A2I0BE06_9ASPA|nr:hypothetical protein AXF42_Ash010421 [Apostasia shenzhenica]
MNPLENCVKARAFPGSDALYCLNTVKNEQGPLHRRPGVVKNEQGSPHHGQMRVKKLVHHTRTQVSRIRLGTWNIGSLTGKLMELVDIMIHKKVNILCLQETKWVGEKAKEIDGLDFKLWYSDKNKNKNGVGIIMDKSLKDHVVEVKRNCDRIMTLKIIINGIIINIVSAYAPQVGLDASIKEKFWNDLEELIQEIPQITFIGGDLNGHVGRVAEEFNSIHGGYSFGEINEEGKTILEFSSAYDLVIANTLFKKREEHVITYKSGTSRTQIDYFLIRKRDRLDCKDCKVIPSECLTTQHRLMVLDSKIKYLRRNNKSKSYPRTRWWNLKNENKFIFKKKVLELGQWNINGETDLMWLTVANCIRKVAKDVLGESKGMIPNNKDTWWWKDDVQEKIKEKKICYRDWFKNKK